MPLLLKSLLTPSFSQYNILSKNKYELTVEVKITAYALGK